MLIISWGVISIIIGILIFIFPRIVNYVVAAWFILTGIGLLIGSSCVPNIPGWPF
ncbi:MAG: DUF3096 domain-containing protein [Dehalococcoidia bacterium]|nr:DUF3096 domain-containing protein [Dehalococcoidia bacterium]MDD5494828.1 DUF3096 domain-containing protein [Dehalococcoidia bacterium]